MKIVCFLIICSLISFLSVSQAPSYKATVYDSSKTSGYYFMAGGLFKMILDKYGNVIYYDSGKPSSNFALQPNGRMSYANLGKYFLMDSTFNIVDSIPCKNNIINDGHDFRILPDGHFLLLGSEIVTMDLSNFCWRGGYDSATASVRVSVLQEQDANKNVVFEWHAKDHFAIADLDTFYINGVSPLDLTHANAVDLDDDGNFLLSVRNYDQIIKINRSDSSVIWRLGGKENEFAFRNLPVPFYGQHNIRRIKNGHITLFDGGNHTVHHGARALEFELDKKNKVATLKWSYVRDSAMYSTAQGSVQRLDNSNTVVDYGAVLIDNVSFVVVDSSGNRILEVDGPASYRTINYSTLPWQLHRPQISCFDSSGTTWLDAGSGYCSYRWNTGSASGIIPVTAVDTYYVFVPYGQSGYISSEKFIVSDLSDPCGKTLSVAAANLKDDAIHLFPNPSYDRTTVTYHLSEKCNVNILLYDMEGRKIIQLASALQQEGDHSTFVNLSQLAPGFYFVRINEQVVKFLKL